MNTTGLKVFEVAHKLSTGDRVIRKEIMVARTLGEALDAYAPDPEANVEFRIRLMGNATVVA
jgi:hypothetical protein